MTVEDNIVTLGDVTLLHNLFLYNVALFIWEQWVCKYVYVIYLLWIKQQIYLHNVFRQFAESSMAAGTVTEPQNTPSDGWHENFQAKIAPVLKVDTVLHIFQLTTQHTLR